MNAEFMNQCAPAERGTDVRRHGAPRFARGARGFSLLEILLVVSIIGLAMAIALPNIGGALLNARADAAARQLLGQLRSARDIAMAQRRTVEVQFLGTREVRAIRIDGALRTTLADLFLENGVQFGLSTGVPDTPDVFGNARAVDFGGPTTIWFLSDGSVVDATNLPISGTVFIAIPSRPLSARAVTVLGPTGRMALYKWNSRTWR